MYLGIIIGLVIGFGIGYLVAPRGKSQTKVEEKVVYMAEDEAEKAANIEKIKSFIADKDKFANDDLESLLGVSNTTIGRYLDELEKEGKIVQHGDTGKFVYYTKK